MPTPEVNHRWIALGLITLALGGCMHTESAKADPTAQANEAVTVRYQVSALDPSIAFYTKQLGFKLDQKTGPFAQVSRGKLTLILSGPGTSGARPMPDGRRQEPGGWNRIVLYVDDLRSDIERLKRAGVHFRNNIETGPGGSQILVDDPDGNPIELHEAPKQAR
jgi:catechol 2,3-dioxygenase-like lactoylglutathione lyase family enzyme